MSSERIKKLPAIIANQIAAGEVIERPSSVIKELLENSLDALSKNITIDLTFGGLNKIRVCDDGIGICKEDLPLAILAHATSKITSLDDLYNINSMGFRGEALASISSVARISIASRTKTDKHAYLLEMNEDGINIFPCARNIGTTVEVLDLFYNAPVRKKFLKGQKTELQYIEDVIKRFALSALHIKITVTHNDKHILTFPAANCASTKLLRIKKIFGHKFLQGALDIETRHENMTLSGLLGSPSYQRSQRDRQWIYLNGRMVKDKLLQHALLKAYQNFLEPGRFPVCLLYLNIAAQDVDVNVHPTKHEVRFKDSRLIHDFLITSISDCLHVEKQENKLPDLDLAIDNKDDFVPPLLLAQTKPAFNSSCKNYYVLNESFVIYLKNTKSYLLNLSGLYKSYYQHLLSKQSYPLVSRPLLVPISFAIFKNQYNFLERLVPYFTDFGIEINFVSQDRIIIRSIAQCMPMLDIKQLLTSVLQTEVLSRQDFMRLIMDCQVCDARQSTTEEINTLFTYLEDMGLFAKYTIELDHSFCMGLF